MEAHLKNNRYKRWCTFSTYANDGWGPNFIFQTQIFRLFSRLFNLSPIFRSHSLQDISCCALTYTSLILPSAQIRSVSMPCHLMKHIELVCNFKKYVKWKIYIQQPRREFTQICVANTTIRWGKGKGNNIKARVSSITLFVGKLQTLSLY